ncbi:hypothetical protein [Mammaliicoccus sciuri]|uniref:hypothetical protein n=1 Tax=Mammaliicoccus sciuri TaxID=1296 RepID=UPI003F543E08
MEKKNSYDETFITDRFNIIVILAIASIVVMSILLFNKTNEHDQLKKELSDKQTTQKAVAAHNKTVDKEVEKFENESGVSDVSYTAQDFNNKYFDWASWEEYDKKIKEIKTTYPNLESNKNVEITGMDVGSGKSPISNFESTEYTTKNKHELAEMITQNKQYEDRITERLFYKVSTLKDGKYDISEFKVYSEAL